MKILVEQELLEMARVGVVNNYEIYVNTNDSGNIPHFHFRYKPDWSKFHTCVCILEPKYFNHGNKQDKLNSQMRKDLDAFMHDTNNAFNMTNYEVLVALWNMNNSDVEIELPIDEIGNVLIPDYKTLKYKY